MKLSAQEEYGLRCLVRLGMQPPGGSLTIAELSRLEAISAPNVAKMMRLLRRAGLVLSARGKDGGYTLARPADRVGVGEVLAVLGGRIFDTRFCERHSGAVALCTHMPDCSIRSVWRRLQEAVDGVLDRLTLKDLLRSEGEMAAWASPHAVALPLAGAVAEGTSRT
ncbi:MAG TPA: Rrf2 family transcriptional regulator [Vicinamibacteria bacterium]|nr:Rrf2 family transcriptional regulator [Vicinamibacteria bacterium]